MSADDRAAQLEMWSEQVNSAVVRIPGRRFPGVVIQGDSLSILLDLAMYVTEHLPPSADSELRGAADELAQKLLDHVRSYECVLSARGVSLPYSRNPARARDRADPDGAAE
jgi:hypothetical protein